MGAGITASDDRGSLPVVVTCSDATNGCTIVRTFTITAVGTCGNTANSNVVYVWTADTLAPSVSVLGGGDLKCNPAAGSLPTVAFVAGLVSATDNCSVTSTNITCKDVTNGCTVIRTFTVTATDHCGNASQPKTVIYTWTVDTLPPVVAVPGGGDLKCNPVAASLPTLSYIAGLVSAVDNCSVMSTNITCKDTTNGCSITRVFTVTATDHCGNISAPQTVVYTWKADVTPPSITCPPTYVITNSLVKYCTFTPGDYGSSCNGSNGASILTNCFKKIYTSGYLQCGLPSAGYCAKFTSASCVQSFVPCTGTPNCLKANYVNPTTCGAGSFGGDVACLELNVDFGDHKDVSGFSGGCGDLVYCDSSSPLNGKCVRQILSLCHTALGGGNISSYGCSISDLHNICTNLNNSFEGCVPSTWCCSHLIPNVITNVPPAISGYPTVTDGCDSSPTVSYHDVCTPGACAGTFSIARTWTAVDGCGLSNSCTQLLTYGNTKASICGYVFLDCDGNGYLTTGIDAGLSNVVVILKNSSNVNVATKTTDGQGSYCFMNLTPGTYTVTVVSAATYTQTAGTCTNHWMDNNGYDCWNECDGYQHWKTTSGTDCWTAKDGYQHYKNSSGQDCWTDKYGYQHSQACTYTSCNAPKNNSETVTLAACVAKTGVNFAYQGTASKATVCVTGPSTAKCGQTISYTCTVTNTGSLCFGSGTVYVCGNSYNCPPLSPGEGCSFQCNYYVKTTDYGNLNCQASANCYGSSGGQKYSYSGNCNTSVSYH